MGKSRLEQELPLDSLGFRRARRYARLTPQELRELMGATPGEEGVALITTEEGARVARRLDGEGEVALRPGDTLVRVGPPVIKGSAPANPRLLLEVDGLRRAGFGGVTEPEVKGGYYRLSLKGLALPRGGRTDALLLLPMNYPMLGPIGFYVKKTAATGSLDQAHLFTRGFHGAPSLEGEGFLWFCSMAVGWRPYEHTLVSFMAWVLEMFNERR